MTKSNLGEILSAFEYFDRNAYDLVRKYVFILLLRFG